MGKAIKTGPAPLAVLTLACAALAGCATASRSGVAQGGDGALFKAQVGDISGGLGPGPHAVWYVQRTPVSYEKLGLASWRTDPERSGFSRWLARLFARPSAHPSATAVAGESSGLPVPSMVEVTNVASGATVEVRVEDREAIGGAVIRLPSDAARSLNADPSKPLMVRLRYKAPVVAWRERPTLQYALRGRAAPRPPVAPRQAETLLASQVHAAPVPVAPAATVIKAALPATAASPVHSAPPTVRPAIAALPLREAQQAPSPSAASHAGFRMQAGAFASLANAHRAVAMLAPAGAARIEPIQRGEQRLYRVIVQGRPNERAEALKAKVAQVGFADARLLPS